VSSEPPFPARHPYAFTEPVEPGILVTGANGFVGRHLIAYLCKYGAGLHLDHMAMKIYAGVLPHEVAALQEDPDESFGVAGWNGGSAGGKVSVVGIDLTDAGGLHAVVNEISPTWIIHLAARSSGADSDREAVYATNVKGTRHLLQAASRYRTGRVLLVSTGYVYGDTDPRCPAREDDALGPLGRYGAYTDSKIEMEALTREYEGSSLVVRAFSHTGPGQSPGFALPGFAQQIVRMERNSDSAAERRLRVGNLSALRDILDVRDVVRAYVELISRGGERPGSVETYNVSSGKPVEMRFVVEQLCGLSSVRPEIEVDPSRMRPLDIACSTGDPSRIATTIGWKPLIPLEQTLQDLLQYWRDR